HNPATYREICGNIRAERLSFRSSTSDRKEQRERKSLEKQVDPHGSSRNPKETATYNKDDLVVAVTRR
ncbi:hypothetical protein RUM43_012004, partial [Polyplax serrata]